MGARGYRAFPLDGQLLLFDRATGENQLWTGRETAHYRQVAPRVLQIAITNVCNKDCSFCYRPLDAASEWTFDELVALAELADDWGVLELAFGGGEPTLFPRFAELLDTIWSRTGLCTSFTTNGSRLTPELAPAARVPAGRAQARLRPTHELRVRRSATQLFAIEGSLMRVQIWNLFSCNNSSDYRLVARFTEAAVAESVARELAEFFSAYAEEFDRICEEN